MRLFKIEKCPKQYYDIIVNDKFIFIQIPKTGSTSIYDECTKNKLVTSLNCYRHEGLNFILQINKNYKELPVYCVVRNPFEQIVSWYLHCKRVHNIKLEFNNWLKENINDVHLSQSDYILVNNKIPDNVKIFKFENGIDKIVEYLNKTHNLNLKTLDLNKNEKYNWKDYYKNKKNIDIVVKHREKEFKLFNYPTNIN